MNFFADLKNDLGFTHLGAELWNVGTMDDGHKTEVLQRLGDMRTLLPIAIEHSAGHQFLTDERDAWDHCDEDKFFKDPVTQNPYAAFTCRQGPTSPAPSRFSLDPAYQDDEWNHELTYLDDLSGLRCARVK